MSNFVLKSKKDGWLFVNLCGQDYKIATTQVCSRRGLETDEIKQPADHVQHPGHVTLRNPETDKVVGCVSPSVSYFSDLVKHIKFRQLRKPKDE